MQNSIPFSVLSTATINSITWNFGDPSSGANNISNALNSSHTFTNTGTYSVTATVNATCGTFTKIILKNIISCAPPFACTGTILVADSCQNAQGNFQVSSSYGINNVQWDFDDPASGITNSSNSLSPSHVFSGNGNYTVRAIVNFRCGIHTIEKSISMISSLPNTSKTEPEERFVSFRMIS